MGDAYTAVADDEATLFYNPAALSRTKGVDLIPLKGNFEFTDILDREIGLDELSFSLNRRFENWPDEPELIANRILGFPIYFKMGNHPHP